MMIIVSKEEAQEILDNRLSNIKDMVNDAWRESKDPQVSMKLLEQAVAMYYESRDLFEQLSKGDLK